MLRTRNGTSWLCFPIHKFNRVFAARPRVLILYHDDQIHSGFWRRGQWDWEGRNWYGSTQYSSGYRIQSTVALASSTGLLLKTTGLKVTSIKIDPYMNIDAGLMRPTEHG